MSGSAFDEAWSKHQAARMPVSSQPSVFNVTQKQAQTPIFNPPDPDSSFSKAWSEQQVVNALSVDTAAKMSTEGFLESAGSSFLELFGVDASPGAKAFRLQNPVTGFASQLIGPGGAFGAAYKISKFTKVAAALDATVARLGVDAAARPILAGAVKETARYAPLELSRLGVGLGTTDTWNDYGNLLGDVGLSMAFTAGFGGIGGFFRSGGKALPKAGRVAGADVGLLPTFEFRLGLDDAATVTGDLNKRQVMFNLKNEALSGLPMGTRVKGQKVMHVQGLEKGQPATEGMLNQLFSPQSSVLSQKALDKRPFDVRVMLEDTAKNTRTLDKGQAEDLVHAAGFKNMDELASTVAYPRIVTVNTQRSAGWLAKELDNAATSGLQKVDDGILMGKEEDGLFVFMKRIRRGAIENPDTKPFARLKVDGEVKSMTLETAKGYAGKVREQLLKNPEDKIVKNLSKRLDGALQRNSVRRFGGQQVSEQDIWLVGKTDKPGAIAPVGHEILSKNISRWGKMAEPFRQAATLDPFNNNMNAILEAMDPSDWAALATMRKKAWLGRMSEKISKKIGEETGLAGQNTVRDTANWLFDVFAPTLYKEQQNPLYARLYGLLRGSMDFADSQLNKIIGGKIKFNKGPVSAMLGDINFTSGFNGNQPLRQLWEQLDDAERQLVVRAAQTQTPAADLKALSAGGEISPKAADAVEALQKINEDVLSQLVLPSLKSAGLESEFKVLEGYILPRIFKGDWMVEVVNEKGVLKWLSAGVTPKAAQQEAEAVVKSAAENGTVYKAKKPQSFTIDKSPDQISSISDMVRLSMGQDAEAQKIVQRAMQHVDSKRTNTGARNLLPSTPATMTHSRTGIAGSPDVTHYTLDDVIAASENHYRQLLRFSAYHSWKQRWMPMATSTLKKENATMFADLERKSSQFLGIEGQITNTINNTLKPLLGNKAGTRIARDTNKLMTAWNLGILNPTFAILNLLTPLQTVAPWISYMTHAPSAEISRMMQAVPRMGADGLPRGAAHFLHPMKVLGESVKQMRNPEPELKQMLEEAVSDGTLAPQLHGEWIGGHSETVKTLRSAYAREGAWGFLKETSFWMANKSENFSRMSAFNSAYLIGKNMFGLSGDQLYRFAKRGTNVTMYGYGVVDRPRVMTGPVGSMFGLFKNWQFHFIGSMAQYAGLGMKDGIWAPMLWQGGAALAMGGLGATPLKLAADGLARWASDSPSSFHWLESNWQDSADEIYFGLPALLGVSLQSSAAIPGTDVRNELAGLSNFVFLERAKEAGKVVGEAWDYAETNGDNPLNNTNIRDKVIGAFAPRAIFRAFSAASGDSVKSMRTGLPVAQDISLRSRLLHGAGLNQVEIERWQVAGRELYKDQAATRTTIQNLGKAYADARMDGDRELMRDIINKTLAMNVPLSSVMNSSATRLRRQDGTALDRYDSAQVQKYTEALKR